MTVPDPTVPTLTVERPSGDAFVPTATPALSWTTRTDIPGWVQAGAELRRDGNRVAAVTGRAAVLQAWPFEPLTPRESASVQVRVRGAEEGWSGWSEPVQVRGGFLSEGEWRAEPIGLPEPDGRAQPGLARVEFELTAPVVSAVLYATALGCYQVAVNGLDVDDQVLKPGWTSYQYRTVHETTDVTALLVPGQNALGVRFAGAWATESYGFRGHQQTFYAEQPRVAVQLVVQHADGTTTEVVSGPGWRVSPGPVTASGIYAGEHHDARLAQHGFAETGFDDSDWVDAQPDRGRVPQARRSPAVRRIEERAVQQVITTPSGGQVLDFGQNLVGRLRLRLSGPAGTVVTLRHAEVLEHGELGTRPLRRAAATDRCTLAGTGEEVWEPEFTFHGFRYAQLDGLPAELDPAAVTAVVLHSDMRRTGWFDCSHELVNQLHENVVWGLRGNFLSVPTDCPQRDERLGWTGDIQVFAPTATFLYDTRGFLSSWLADLALEQADHGGTVPFVVPNPMGSTRPAAAWGDAATVVPWVLHERYGDRAVLAEQLPSARAWTDLVLRLSGEDLLWEGDFQFGDWLDPAAPPDRPADSATDPGLVATAYVFRSADLTARMAELLGRTEVARSYRERAEQVREAFLAAYVTPAGRMMSDAQTAYAVALVFELVPSEQRAALGRRLADLVREQGYRIGTGFVGTPIIADALTATDHGDVAARLLTQTENPSWLYPVTMGATTIWERWDSMLPDGTINPGQMTSFNHYAFGAVADFLHRVLAGLAPAEPGYRVVRVAPTLLPGFEHARAEHHGPYGPVSVGWHRDGDHVVVRAEIPPNSTAEVRLPDGTELVVGSGSHEWTAFAPAEPVRHAPLTVGSSLAQLVDDPAGYAALFEVLDGVDPGVSADVRAHTRWVPGRALEELLGRHATGDARQQLERRFAEINLDRG